MTRTMPRAARAPALLIPTDTLHVVEEGAGIIIPVSQMRSSSLRKEFFLRLKN